jgi:hypothetical protein
MLGTPAARRTSAGRRPRTPSKVRRKVRGGLTLALVIFVGWFLIAASGVTLATGTVTNHKWTAPYTGVTSRSHTKKSFSCATVTFGGDSFDRTTGNVTGGGSLTAMSCTSGGGVSNAELLAKSQIKLPVFTHENGSVLVTVRWVLDFDVKASLSGSPCGMGDNYSTAYATIAAGVVDVSNDTILKDTTRSWGASLYTTGSDETDVHVTGNLKITLVLDPATTYQIVTGLGFDLQVQTSNPSPGFPAACTADASIVPGSGSVLGALVYAQVG